MDTQIWAYPGRSSEMTGSKIQTRFLLTICSAGLLIMFLASGAFAASEPGSNGGASGIQTPPEQEPIVDHVDKAVQKIISMYFSKNKSAGDTANLEPAQGSSMKIADATGLDTMIQIKSENPPAQNPPAQLETIARVSEEGPSINSELIGVAHVPEPSTLLLLGSGVLAFGILGRRKLRR